MTVGIFVND